jgi:hypothetical protein
MLFLALVDFVAGFTCDGLLEGTCGSTALQALQARNYCAGLGCPAVLGALRWRGLGHLFIGAKQAGNFRWRGFTAANFFHGRGLALVIFLHRAFDDVFGFNDSGAEAQKSDSKASFQDGFHGYVGCWGGLLGDKDQKR